MQTALSPLTGSDYFLAAYRLQAEAGGVAEPTWLSAQRRQAIEQFQDSGFPSTQEEDWRYTNVSPISQTAFQLSPASTQQVTAIPGDWDWPAAARLVFVNGQYRADLSSATVLPKGLLVGNLRALLADTGTADTLRVYLGRTLQAARHGFTSLNTALWLDGPCVIVPAGVTLAEPIHLVHVTQAENGAIACHPRTLVICQRDAQVCIVETYESAGDGVGLSNAVTEVIAAESAVLDYYKSVHDNSRSFHVGLLQMYASRDAQISAFASSFGGDLVRNEVHAVLDDEGGDCTLNGLYAAQGVEHVDNHTTIDHAKPHCASRQFYNGILDGHATGVFNGRVIVRPNAQKTDAVQKNRNLLLSKDATIDSKPQLEISANDVRCTHGATVGQMDQEALFFLRSRGLSREAAVSLLVQAFASEILDKVKVPGYRTRLEKDLASWILGSSAETRN